MARITKRMTREVTGEHVVGIRCDLCGKEIEPSVSPTGLEYVRFAECSWRHGEWGNDSGDSCEDFDICPDCIDRWLDIARRYLGDHVETGSISIDMVYEVIG